MPDGGSPFGGPEALFPRYRGMIGSGSVAASQRTLPRLALPRYVEPQEHAAAPADDEVVEKKLHEIRFEIIEVDPDGKELGPVPGVSLGVKLPANQEKTGKSGGNGKLAWDRLEAGTCDVLRMLDQHAYAVVSFE
jgi:hypothetical protein